MNFFYLSILSLSLVGIVSCEGPEGQVGPRGPMGPEGPAGPQGLPAEGILIEIHLSASTYDESGEVIAIQDSRITPKTFRALYLKVDFGAGEVAYVPLDYLLVFSVSLVPEALELETPVLAVLEGLLVITDPNQDLLVVAFAVAGVTVNLAVLVSG